MTEITSLELARLAGRTALEKKAFDVKILKVKDISSVCDYFVIISGDADIHVKALGQHLLDELMERGIKPYHKEGLNDGGWVLLDYVDVVVHIFRESVRNFYALEKLWGDAPSETLTDE